jgi:hypothetical protein
MNFEIPFPRPVSPVPAYLVSEIVGPTFRQRSSTGFGARLKSRTPNGCAVSSMKSVFGAMGVSPGIEFLTDRLEFVEANPEPRRLIPRNNPKPFPSLTGARAISAPASTLRRNGDTSSGSGDVSQVFTLAFGQSLETTQHQRSKERLFLPMFSRLRRANSMTR